MLELLISQVWLTYPALTWNVTLHGVRKRFGGGAELGSAEAELALGYLYERGFGVPRDYRRAMSYYKAAADQCNSTAANNLGAMYESGRGVSVNLREAARWFRIAAESGNPAGQANLGGLYFYGKGVRRDYSQAAEWDIDVAARINGDRAEAGWL